MPLGPFCRALWGLGQPTAVAMSSPNPDKMSGIGGQREGYEKPLGVVTYGQLFTAVLGTPVGKRYLARPGLCGLTSQEAYLPRSFRSWPLAARFGGQGFHRLDHDPSHSAAVPWAAPL